MRGLAQQLLAIEAANRAEAEVHEAVRVCEKLRISLTRFAGADGFTSLLRRALALARSEVAALDGIKVSSHGSLEGLEALAAQSDHEATQAAVAMTANLLALLMTFIGQPLTLRLVREAWPHASLDG